MGSSMALQVASLYGVLNLQDNMTSSLNSAMGNARSFGSSINNLVTGNVQRLGTVMAGVATTGAAAFAGMAAAGVREFASVERGMNEVFTLMPGVTQSAMSQMTDSVNVFSNRFGTLPTEVIPALYQSLSAGVPSDNVFEFLETAQMAAIGGVTDLNTAVDGITSVMNAYGTDVISATQASDLMFTAVRLGKTNFEELSSSLFNVIPTASSLGVEFGSVTAGLAAITAQGVPTSVATTQMRQLFVELGDSATGVGSTFQQVAGSSFQDFIAGGGDVAGALQLLYDHAEDTGLNIDQLFSSVEAGGAALALTGQGADRFTSFLSQMNGAAGATQSAFNTMNSGISRNMDMLNASFHVLLGNFGSLFAPAVEPVIATMTTLARVFGDVLSTGDPMNDWIGDLPAPLRFLGFAVADAAAGFRSFMLNFQEFGANLSSNIALMGPFNGVMEGLQTMLFNMGIPTSFIGQLQSMGNSIGAMLQPVMSWIQSNVELKDVLIATGIAIGSVVVPAVIGMAAPIVGTFAVLVGAVTLVRTAWQNNFGGIQEKTGAFVSWFTGTAMPGIRDFILNQAIPAAISLGNTLSNIWTTVSPHLTNLYNWFVSTGLPGIQNFISGTVIPGITSFTNTISNIWTLVEPSLTSFYNWFMTTGLPGIDEFINSTVVPTVTSFTTTISNIWSLIEPTLTSVYDWFMTTGLPLVNDYISGPFTDTVSAITTALSTIWDTVSPGLTLFQTSIESIFSSILTNAINPVSDALTSAFNAYTNFTSWSGNALDSAGNFVNNLNPFGGGNNQVAGARAAGGPVTAGRQYLVGEQGPELFTPSSSGNISSNRDTQMAFAGGGSGDVHFHGDVHINGVNSVEELYRDIQERRRRRS